MPRHRLYAASALLAGLLPFSVHASGLIKGSSSAVYYVEEGRRYVFPNESVYRSWYQDFSGVETVDDRELASYLIGGNVTYKPGSRLVKIQSDPKVYAVGPGGALRWIASEDAARALYGDGWPKRVDDIPDGQFPDYRQGSSVAGAPDFDMNAAKAVSSISDDLAARTGAPAPQDFTAVRSGAWSENSTWGGKRPSSGAHVTIPSGIKVLYDLADAPSVKSLDVDGALEFYPGMSTRLSVRKIAVRGALTIGTSEAPLPSDVQAEIFLTADAPGDDGFVIDGGRLSLHGAVSGPSWTRLSAPSANGARSLEVDPPVRWPVGGEVAVLGAKAGSAPEIRKIAAIEGAKIVLDAPLAATHRSEEGLRTEIVLLSRNVTIRGVGAGNGSYVRAFDRASVDVSSVAFRDLGRKGTEGQYPLGLEGLEAGSIKDSVIRSSGNRCLTLRRTSGVTVEGVVGIDAYGHCFATAEGTETGNVFRHDLAAYIHPGAMAEDAIPAAFFMKNPDNVLSENVAVGSEGHGYWYDLPENAMKDGGAALKPRETALGAFMGNYARGNRKAGLYLDDEAKGRLNYAPERKAVFSKFSSVMNGERGFWIRGSNIEVSGAYLAENPIGGTFAAFGAALKDSDVLGRLKGSEAPGPARYGFTYLDGPVSVQDVRFSRFVAPSAALGFEEKDPALPDPRNSLRGVSFTDARAWRFQDPVTPGDAMAMVRDLDNGDVIAGRSDFLGPHCVPDKDSGGVRCADAYAQVSVALRDSPGDKNITFTNLSTKASVTLVPGPAFDGRYAYATVAEGGSYRVEVPNVNTVRVEYDGLSAPLKIRIPASLSAQVISDGRLLPKKELPDLVPGAWAYDAAAKEAALWLAQGDAYELSR